MSALPPVSGHRSTTLDRPHVEAATSLSALYLVPRSQLFVDLQGLHVTVVLLDHVHAGAHVDG